MAYLIFSRAKKRGGGIGKRESPYHNGFPSLFLPSPGRKRRPTQDNHSSLFLFPSFFLSSRDAKKIFLPLFSSLFLPSLGHRTASMDDDGASRYTMVARVPDPPFPAVRDGGAAYRVNEACTRHPTLRISLCVLVPKKMDGERRQYVDTGRPLCPFCSSRTNPDCRG